MKPFERSERLARELERRVAAGEVTAARAMEMIERMTEIDGEALADASVKAMEIIARITHSLIERDRRDRGVPTPVAH